VYREEIRVLLTFENMRIDEEVCSRAIEIKACRPARFIWTKCECLETTLSEFALSSRWSESEKVVTLFNNSLEQNNTIFKTASVWILEQ
jgi:hypothetical protein